CTAWLVIFMACARLGITVVSMNTRFRSREVGDLIARGRCRWLAMWPDFKGLPFQQILDDVEPERLKALEGVMTVGASPDRERVRAAAAFAYTLPAPPDALDGAPKARG